MTEAAPPPPPPVLPPQPPALARAIALDLVTRFHLRLTDQRDSRLGALREQYELGAAGWTGRVATFVGFYTPSANPTVAGHDLAARCAAAAQWAQDRLSAQGAERADVLIVALGPMQGSIAPPSLNPAVNVGALAVDPATADVVTILPAPRALPSTGDVRTRARMLLSGVEAPTLAAVDLAERQSVAGGYAAPARQQLSSTPYMTFALIASFVAVFIVEKLLVSSASADAQGQGLFNLGSLVVAPTYPLDWWRFVSSAFIHDPSGSFGIDFVSLHLVFNCIAMYLIGRLVEQLYGRLVLLSTFLITAVGGNLLWVAFAGGAGGLSFGASGGIVGLLGLLFMLGRLQGKGVPTGIAHAMRQYALTYFVMVVIFGFVVNGTGADNVNQFAHIGGAIAGAGVGALVPPLHRIGGRDLSRWERIGAWLVIGLGALALMFALVNVLTNLDTYGFVTGPGQFPGGG